MAQIERRLTNWTVKGTGNKLLRNLKAPGDFRNWPSDVTRDGVGYGVMNGTMDIRRETIKAGFHYGYADGPYFLAVKPSHIRIAWDGLWFTGGPDIRGDLDKAGCVMREWNQGDEVQVCPSADVVHRNGYGDDAASWVSKTVAELRKYTDRPIVVRTKGETGSPSNIPKRLKIMDAAFKKAWAVVTSGSTIGVEAICRGVPVFTTRKCAASPMASSDLSRIEIPRLPCMDERRVWAQNLASRQFSVSDLSTGKAWTVLKTDLECMT